MIRLGEKKKSTLSFGALLSITFTFYILGSIMSDAIYVFAPQLYDIALYVLGSLALIFIVLSFIYAIKEKNIPVLLFFAFICLLFFIPFLGG